MHSSPPSVFVPNSNTFHGHSCYESGTRTLENGASLYDLPDPEDQVCRRSTMQSVLSSQTAL